MHFPRAQIARAYQPRSLPLPIPLASYTSDNCFRFSSFPLPPAAFQPSADRFLSRLDVFPVVLSARNLRIDPSIDTSPRWIFDRFFAPGFLKPRNALLMASTDSIDFNVSFREKWFVRRWIWFVRGCRLLAFFLTLELAASLSRDLAFTDTRKYTRC